MKQVQRTFGQWQVTITDDQIAIKGDWRSNYGVIYCNRLLEWLDYYNNNLLELWTCPQVIGVDSGLSSNQVKNYIYKYIAKNYKYLMENFA